MKTTLTEYVLIGALAAVVLVSLGIYFRQSFVTAYHNFQLPNDGEVPTN